jgi:hypothetical protein
MSPGNLYAFTEIRRGEFLLFLKRQDSVCEFMQLPDRYKLALTLEEFQKGIETGLLDFVEQVPEDVFKVCEDNLLDLQKT